jgi:hypothetical protein
LQKNIIFLVACKRNFIDIVKYLVQNGASNDKTNLECKKPSFYSKEKEIKEF